MKITIDGGHVIEGKPGELKEYFELMGVEFPVKEATSKFKKGDRVKAIADGEFRDVKAGEIGEITDTDAAEGNESDPYSVRVYAEDDYDFFRPQDLELVEEKPYKPSEMRPATDEEKAQYEQALKFAKLGRKPGEFKKGDIVMTHDDISGHNGVIGEVIAPNEGGTPGRPLVKARLEDGRTGELFSDSTLIAPVEARVDVG